MSHNAAFCSRPAVISFASQRATSYRSVTCALTSDKRAVDQNATSHTADVRFASWAKQNKINMSSLALTALSKNGKKRERGQRGMMAETSLKKGDMLISVDRKATLQVTSLDRKKTPLPGKVAQQTWQKLPWYARLALLIISAKIDPSSPLQPWVSRLPSSFDTPFHWSDKELLELQNPRMTKAVHEQRKMYRGFYDDINGNPDNSIARDMKYADFVWAMECVRSRAFSGSLEVAPFKDRLRLFLFIAANTLVWPTLNLIPLENAINGGLTALFALAMYDIILPRILRVVQGAQLKRFAMTPGIDFFNHSSSVTGQAEVSFEYFRDRFIVQAGEDYKAGDEVFISYGAQSNDSFLQYYGFVEENNPAETFVFGRDIEKMLGVSAGRLVARRSGFDKSTLSAVTKKLSGNKEAALTTLRELCEAELGSMATSLEEDIELLKGDSVKDSPRLELAVTYRKEKKELLRAVSKKRE